MTFTEAYRKVLSPFSKRYEEAENGKAGRAVLKEAADAVVKSRDLLEDKGDLPKDLEKVRFFLFYFILFISLFLLSFHCNFHIFFTSGHCSLFQ
jgi:hypothetical protein